MHLAEGAYGFTNCDWCTTRIYVRVVFIRGLEVLLSRAARRSRPPGIHLQQHVARGRVLSLTEISMPQTVGPLRNSGTMWAVCNPQIWCAWRSIVNTSNLSNKISNTRFTNPTLTSLFNCIAGKKLRSEVSSAPKKSRGWSKRDGSVEVIWHANSAVWKYDNASFEEKLERYSR